MRNFTSFRRAPERTLLQDSGVSATPRVAGEWEPSVQWWRESTVVNIFDGPIPQFQTHFYGDEVRRVVICGDCGTPGYGMSWSCRNDGGYNIACWSTSIAGFIVDADHAHFVRKTENVRAQTWFHLAGSPNWDAEVRAANAPVHLGDLNTVRNLAAIDLEYGDGEFWLHELTIDPFASIASHVGPDMDDRWTGHIDGLEHDVVPYINAYETPGCISLLANPHRLHITQTTFMDPGALEEFAHG